MSTFYRRVKLLIRGSRLWNSGLVQDDTQDTQPLSPRVHTYDETPSDLPL